MNQREKRQALAKKKARKLKKLKQDPRYRKVMGRLAHERLIDTQVKKSPRRFTAQEALWVGENIEPRVLELLPAIVIKKPAILMTEDFPEDLRTAVNSLRRGEAKVSFRNIPLKKCDGWLPHIGRKGAYPTATKNFRLRREDLETLKALSQKLSLSEAGVIKEALKYFAQKHGNTN